MSDLPIPTAGGAVNRPRKNAVDRIGRSAECRQIHTFQLIDRPESARRQLARQDR